MTRIINYAVKDLHMLLVPKSQSPILLDQYSTDIAMLKNTYDDPKVNLRFVNMCIFDSILHCFAVLKMDHGLLFQKTTTGFDYTPLLESMVLGNSRATACQRRSEALLNYIEPDDGVVDLNGFIDEQLGLLFGDLSRETSEGTLFADCLLLWRCATPLGNKSVL